MTLPKSTSKSPPLPPILLIFTVLLGGFLEHYKRLPFWPPSPGFKVLPVSLLLAAAALAGTAITSMQRRDTPLHPKDTPRALVTTGPFRISRNPIYLALLLVLVAIGMVFNSLWFIFLVPLLIVLLSTLVIPREERALSNGFGIEYGDYRRRVRRWL